MPTRTPPPIRARARAPRERPRRRRCRPRRARWRHACRGCRSPISRARCARTTESILRAALSLDAMGTLLHAREPVAEVYARAAASRGSAVDAAEVAARLRDALQRFRPLRGLDPGW